VFKASARDNNSAALVSTQVLFSGLDNNFGHFVLIFLEPEKYRWSYKWLIVP